MTAERNDVLGRFARHKVGANLLMVMLLLGGFLALAELNRQFFPTFATDFVTVRVVWPGASAEDVEQSITVPLEQEFRSLDHVKEMRSTSSQGISSIIIEYEQNTDMGIALDQVNESVSLVRNLPPDAERPEVTKFIRNEDIATLILTGAQRLENLRPLAHRFEAELLDRGIAKVNFIGLPEREIAIEVPSSQIAALGRSLPQLGQLIQEQSQDIAAGTVGEEDSAREIRGLERKRSAREFAELQLLTTGDGRRLRLDDIATVTPRNREDAAEIFYQGQPAVLMQLQRTENSDALDAADIMNEWLLETRPTLAEGLQLVPFNEQYELIEDRIDLLIKNGASGLVLVIAILFIFLNGRVAFWVTAGIPVALMGSLAALWLAGGSINMISLFALIMALGIIVDDAIVVAEDAMTHYEQGERSLEAAEGGARRMLVPVIASSMTTIAAFLPLLLISGIIGEILRDIPFVVICVIIASLVEAFLILPGHLRGSFHRHHHKPPSAIRLTLDNGFNRFRDQVFRPVAAWTLAHRGTTVMATVCALALSIALVVSGVSQFTFFPSPEGSNMVASVRFAAGTPPSRVAEFGQRMEDTLWELERELGDGQDLIKVALLRLNQGSFNGGQSIERGQQYAMVAVELVAPDNRNASNKDVAEAWRDALRLPAGVEQLSITEPDGGPPGRPVDILITGAEPEVLKRAAEDVKAALAEFTGVTDILDDLPWGRQQFVFKLTPMAQSLGMSVEDVGRQMRAALDGQLLQVFYDAYDEIEVRILLPQAERDAQRVLESLPLITPTGAVAPLANLVELESRRGLAVLRHSDGRMGVRVTADVNTEITNANTIIDELRRSVLPDISGQYGVTTDFKGRAEDQDQTLGDMKTGALMGLTLIYIILAWVFGSYTWPLAVMLAIPFGLIGAISGHALLGIDLTVLSLFGMFGLSGIVINDSIILVTHYKVLRERGAGIDEALLETACQRLRAVLLTSLTTIGGLTPLLFETSVQAQFLIPMAASISFGLAVGTVLILLVIPVLLSLIEDATLWWNLQIQARQP